MDSTTLPAQTAPAKPTLTIEAVVARWVESHGKTVEAALRLGAMAQKFLVHRLRAAADPGERRRMRAAAVHEIENRLHKAGLRGDAINVSRHIACAAVYGLLRGDCEAAPAWRLLRALVPLVRRGAGDEWTCRADIEKARGLFRQVVECRPSIESVVSEVRQILGRTPKQPRRPATAFDRALAAIGRLDSLAYLQQAAEAIQKLIEEMRSTQPKAAA